MLFALSLLPTFSPGLARRPESVRVRQATGEDSSRDRWVILFGCWGKIGKSFEFLNENWKPILNQFECHARGKFDKCSVSCNISNSFCCVNFWDRNLLYSEQSLTLSTFETNLTNTIWGKKSMSVNLYGLHYLKSEFILKVLRLYLKFKTNVIKTPEKVSLHLRYFHTTPVSLNININQSLRSTQMITIMDWMGSERGHRVNFCVGFFVSRVKLLTVCKYTG